MGERRFGSVNWIGLQTLAWRETKRFLTVYTQTILAPLATAALFLTVFTLAFADRQAAAGGILGENSFAAFLAPGVVMMTVIQNAFANTSSSVMVAKVQGNIVDTLTPPLSAAEIVIGFAAGAVLRGMIVALLCMVFLFPFVGVALAHPLWSLYFAFIGSLTLAFLGLAAAVWAVKFDHIAAVTNFIVTPLSFLSGTFYSVSRLPDFWAQLSYMNPFFYLIDGFRYGAIGQSDADPWFGAVATTVLAALLGLMCWRMFAVGYRLKS